MSEFTAPTINIRSLPTYVGDYVINYGLVISFTNKPSR